MVAFLAGSVSTIDHCRLASLKTLLSSSVSRNCAWVAAGRDMASQTWPNSRKSQNLKNRSFVGASSSALEGNFQKEFSSCVSLSSGVDSGWVLQLAVLQYAICTSDVMGDLADVFL